ncbi:hypothetical protein B0H14DRAFT_2603624 [Mycena olivaceomarginata]|nr:hypothetical protein B0H14DRAFT_2603624 [Mycena olivaceomarginata]
MSTGATESNLAEPRFPDVRRCDKEGVFKAQWRHGGKGLLATKFVFGSSVVDINEDRSEGSRGQMGIHRMRLYLCASQITRKKEEIFSARKPDNRLIVAGSRTRSQMYSRLKPLAGNLAPQYFGVFVAQIPGPERPRHVYVILLRHIEGSDVRQLMGDGAAERACAEHKTSIIDAAARVLYQFFRLGISPTDLKDSNTILQLPRTPSNEDFCTFPTCPFRHFIHIDFTFDASCPQSPGHAYTPRAFIIDLERAIFYSENSAIVGEADIQDCRVNTIQQWPSQ